MKRILIFIALFFYAWNSVFSSENNSETIIENIENLPVIMEDSTLLDDFLEKRKEVFELAEESKEEKDIKSIENLLQEIEIKKEFNNELVKDVRGELQSINETLIENKKIIDYLSQESSLWVEAKIQLETATKTVGELKTKLNFKEKLIEDLESTIQWYEILEQKYTVLLWQYTNVKKQLITKQNDQTRQNYTYLFIIFIIAGFIYLIKKIIEKFFFTKYETPLLYFDLIYWIVLTLVLVSYSFSIFPQLYLVMIFVASSIVIVLGHFISSFVASFSILKKFSIWDVVQIKGDMWKIIRISPISTVLRSMNTNGFLTNRLLHVSNDAMLKEQVIKIEKADIRGYYCTIVLPMKRNINFFKIIDEIEKDVLWVIHFPKAQHVDKNDHDNFKISYNQVKSTEIEVKFYWRSDMITNRKIEKRILWVVKRHLDEIDDMENIIKEEKEKALND